MLSYSLSTKDDGEPVIIPAKGYKKIATGLCIDFGDLKGYYCQIIDHSFGGYVSAGVIDKDFKGEIYVLVQNFSKVPLEFGPRKEFARLLLFRIETPPVYEMRCESSTSTGCMVGKNLMDETQKVRGAGGFGSTGTGQSEDDGPLLGGLWEDLCNDYGEVEKETKQKNQQGNRSKEEGERVQDLNKECQRGKRQEHVQEASGDHRRGGHLKRRKHQWSYHPYLSASHLKNCS
nr:MAG: wsv112-like protein [Metapenaeus ensis nimavirus]